LEIGYGVCTLALGLEGCGINLPDLGAGGTYPLGLNAIGIATAAYGLGSPPFFSSLAASISLFFFSAAILSIYAILSFIVILSSGINGSLLGLVGYGTGGGVGSAAPPALLPNCLFKKATLYAIVICS